MGASIVLRHAGLIGGVDAVVSVSGPGRWYYRGTPSMRRVHWAVEHRIGRILAKRFLNTRISQGRWDPVPLPPAEAAASIAPTPLLIVHGDRDEYFPADHAEQLFEAASSPRISGSCPASGMRSAGATNALIDRIGRWAHGRRRRCAVSPERRRLAAGEAPAQQARCGGEALLASVLVLSRTTPISSLPPRLASKSRQ